MLSSLSESPLFTVYRRRRKAPTRVPWKRPSYFLVSRRLFISDRLVGLGCRCRLVLGLRQWWLCRVRRSRSWRLVHAVQHSHRPIRPRHVHGSL